ncbi:MAG: hypothetical protein GF383_06825 [Candidatus Lokiarchaeota archaeon]|nr:hypothetical protein [Candidatus Lokiarchaeota archaeon]MBD3339835.1 hypothetical protein [Candidatus Lokiarchaeota archaeon]
MEFPSLIIQYFDIEELNLKYYVGISQILFDCSSLMKTLNMKTKKQLLDYIFDLIEQNQSKYNLAFQIISPNHVLNQDHIYAACYYLKRAFATKTNISNNENIELLLYLSASRQIKVGIDRFGLNTQVLKDGKLLLCAISEKNNVEKSILDVNNKLSGNEIKPFHGINSLENFTKIKNLFEFNENQIFTILSSNGIDISSKNLNELDLDALYLSLEELIFEEMALLSLEKININ